MIKSESIKNLAIALAKFQSEMKAVKKGAINPFFKSKYADLASIIEAIREPLAENKLSFSQFPTGENGLTTILMHESGEFIEDTYFLKPVDAKPQSAGSCLTYARRYALSSVLGISTEEDDDGNAASEPVVQYGAPKKKWEKKPTDIFAHIKSQLKDLGFDPRTLGEASKLTQSLTQLELNEGNITEIENRLGVKIQEKEPSI